MQQRSPKVRPRTTMAPIWAGLAAIATLLSGCTLYSPAQRDSGDVGELLLNSPEAMAPLTPTDWPSRRTTDLASMVARTPREISWWRLDGSKTPEELDPRIRRRVERPEAVVSYTGVHGVGIIRVFDDPRTEQGEPAAASTQAAARAGEGPTMQVAGRPFAPMRFVSLSNLPDRPVDQRIRRFERWIRRNPSAGNSQSGVCMNDPEVLAMLWEGTGIRVVPPAPGAAARGTVIHMPGLGSMEYEQPVLDELTKRGWWIVRVSTPRLWWLEDTSYEVKSKDEVPALGERIAAVVDDLLAEPAYAAEAGMDYLASHRPEVPQRPLMLLGMSAGALMMPAVAARLGERVDGMVLVGGGANLLKISQESELTDGGLKIKWGDGLESRAARQTLYDAYLGASRLDPYTLAHTLRDVPALLVLASMDSIVPADSGRLLWERLGRPARYSTPFGHALLFWQLSSQAEPIANWMDQTAAHAGHPPPTTPAHRPAASTSP